MIRTSLIKNCIHKSSRSKRRLRPSIYNMTLQDVPCIIELWRKDTLRSQFESLISCYGTWSWPYLTRVLLCLDKIHKDSFTCVTIANCRSHSIKKIRIDDQRQFHFLYEDIITYTNTRPSWASINNIRGHIH